MDDSVFKKHLVHAGEKAADFIRREKAGHPLSDSSVSPSMKLLHEAKYSQKENNKSHDPIYPSSKKNKGGKE